MTTTDKLRKHYDVLSHRERLALLVEAMEREDEGEMRSLWQSLPVKTYRLSDPEFTESFEGMMDVAMVFSGLAKEYLITYLILFSGVRMLELADFPKGSDPDFKEKLAVWEEKTKKLNKIMDALERTQAEGKGAMRAFETICRENCFDPEKVLAATHCAIPDLFWSLILESEADPDKETTDNLLAAFRQRWKIPAMV